MRASGIEKGAFDGPIVSAQEEAVLLITPRKLPSDIDGVSLDLDCGWLRIKPVVLIRWGKEHRGFMVLVIVNNQLPRSAQSHQRLGLLCF